jgi:hypothetical protein
MIEALPVVDSIYSDEIARTWLYNKNVIVKSVHGPNEKAGMKTIE